MKQNKGMITVSFYERNKYFFQKRLSSVDDRWLSQHKSRILLNPVSNFTPFFLLDLNFSPNVILEYEKILGRIKFRNSPYHTPEILKGIYRNIDKGKKHNMLFALSQVSKFGKEETRNSLVQKLQMACDNYITSVPDGFLYFPIKKKACALRELPEKLKLSFMDAFKIKGNQFFSDLYLLAEKDGDSARELFCLCVKDSRIKEVKEKIIFGEQVSPDCFVLIRNTCQVASVEKVLSKEEEFFSNIGVEIIRDKESVFIREGTTFKKLDFVKKLERDAELVRGILRRDLDLSKTYFF